MLLKRLLEAFLTPGTGTILEILQKDRDLIFTAVRAILSFLPQFDWAEGAILSDLKKQVLPDHLSKLRTEGVVWISKDQKGDTWLEGIRSETAATRLYYLLSKVEAVQWANDNWTGDCYFGVIPDLHRFLKISAPKCTDACLRSYSEALKSLAASLARVSIYFTCGEPSSETLRLELARTLFDHSDKLVSVVNTMHRALDCCISGVSVGWCLPDADSTCQSLLNVLAPQVLVSLSRPFAPSGSKEKIVRVRQATMEDARSLEPGEVLSNPWGVYANDRSSESEQLVQECRRPMGTFIAHDRGLIFSLPPHDERNLQIGLIFDETESAQRVTESTAFAGLWFADATTFWNQDNNKVPADWYTRAFGPLYAHFDRVRQTDADHADVSHGGDAPVLRDTQEIPFYRAIFDRLECPSLHILDVGIGYGRLARKLHSELPQIRISGVDLSPFLADLAQAVPGVDCVKLGDMRRLDQRYEADSFDVVLFSFTTFGCFGHENSNRQCLRAATTVLAPGGLVVIEQYAPMTRVFARPTWAPPSAQVVANLAPEVLSELPGAGVIKDCRLALVKTSRFVPQPSREHTQYEGEYRYYLADEDGTWLVRNDPYRLLLYSPAWFEREFKAAGLVDISFLWDFDVNSACGAAEVTDERLNGSEYMICVARKPATVDGDSVPCLSDTRRERGTARISSAIEWLSLMADWARNKYETMDNDYLRLYKAVSAKARQLNPHDANQIRVACSWPDDEFDNIDTAKSDSGKWNTEFGKSALESLRKFINDVLHEPKD